MDNFTYTRVQFTVRPNQSVMTLFLNVPLHPQCRSYVINSLTQVIFTYKLTGLNVSVQNLTQILVKI